MPTVAELMVSIQGDASGALSALDATDSRIASTAGNATSLLGGLQVAAGALGVAADAAIVTSIGAAASFQTMMSQMQANTTLTNQQISFVSDAIRQMARDTGAPLTELARGLEHITNLGYEGQQSIDILDAAMKSALSTGANVGDTANMLAMTMKEFASANLSAATTMNVLHLAAAQGNMRLEEMVQYGGKAISTAGNLGLQLDETAAALAAMTEHGFNAATASTQLTGILTHLINPSKAAQGEIAALSKATGVDLVTDFSLAGVEAKGLRQVFEDITKATSTHKEEVFKLIPALRGGQGALALSALAAGDYTRILQSLRDTEAGLTDPTTDAFNRQQDTAAGLWNKVKANVSDLAITIGQQFLPAIEGVLTPIARASESLSMWVATHGRLVASILSVVAAVGSMVGAFAFFHAAAGMLGPVLGPIAPMLAGIAAPIAILIGVSAALAMAWRNDWLNIHEALKTPLELLSYFKDVLGDVLGWLAKDWSANGFVQMLRDLPTILSWAWSGIQQTFKNFGIGWDTLLNPLKNIGTLLLDGLRAGGDIAGDIAGWLRDQLARINWGDVWSGIQSVAGAAGSGILRLLSGGVDLAVQLGGWLRDQVGRINWGDVWSGVQAAGSGILRLLEGAGDVAQQLGAWVKDQVSRVDWAGIWSGVQGAGSGIAHLFDQVDVSGALDGLRTKLQDLGNTIETWIAEKLPALDGLYTTLGQLAKLDLLGVVQWVQSIGQALAEIGSHGDAATTLSASGSALSAIGTAVKVAAPYIVDVAGGIAAVALAFASIMATGAVADFKLFLDIITNLNTPLKGLALGIGVLAGYFWILEPAIIAVGTALVGLIAANPEIAIFIAIGTAAALLATQLRGVSQAEKDWAAASKTAAADVVQTLATASAAHLSQASVIDLVRQKRDASNATLEANRVILESYIQGLANEHLGHEINVGEIAKHDSFLKGLLDSQTNGLAISQAYNTALHGLESAHAAAGAAASASGQSHAFATTVANGLASALNAVWQAALQTQKLHDMASAADGLARSFDAARRAHDELMNAPTAAQETARGQLALYNAELVNYQHILATATPGTAAYADAYNQVNTVLPGLISSTQGYSSQVDANVTAVRSLVDLHARGVITDAQYAAGMAVLSQTTAAQPEIIGQVTAAQQTSTAANQAAATALGVLAATLNPFHTTLQTTQTVVAETGTSIAGLGETSVLSAAQVGPAWVPVPGFVGAALAPLPGIVRGVVDQAAGTAAAGGVAVGDAIGGGINSGMGRWLGSLIATAVGLVSQAIAAAKAAAESKSPSEVAAREVGLPIAQGMALGMTRGATAVAGASTDLANTAIDTLLTGLDAHSPSRRGHKAGATVPEGVANGIHAGRTAVVTEVQTLAALIPQELLTELTANNAKLTVGMARVITAALAEGGDAVRGGSAELAALMTTTLADTITTSGSVPSLATTRMILRVLDEAGSTAVGGSMALANTISDTLAGVIRETGSVPSAAQVKVIGDMFRAADRAARDGSTTLVADMQNNLGELIALHGGIPDAAFLREWGKMFTHLTNLSDRSGTDLVTAAMQTIADVADATGDIPTAAFVKVIDHLYAAMGDAARGGSQELVTATMEQIAAYVAATGDVPTTAMVTLWTSIFPKLAAISNLGAQAAVGAFFDGVTTLTDALGAPASAALQRWWARELTKLRFTTPIPSSGDPDLDPQANANLANVHTAGDAAARLAAFIKANGGGEPDAAMRATLGRLLQNEPGKLDPLTQIAQQWNDSTDSPINTKLLNVFAKLFDSAGHYVNAQAEQVGRQLMQYAATGVSETGTVPSDAAMNVLREVLSRAEDVTKGGSAQLGTMISQTLAAGITATGDLPSDAYIKSVGSMITRAGDTTHGGSLALATLMSTDLARYISDSGHLPSDAMLSSLKKLFDAATTDGMFNMQTLGPLMNQVFAQGLANSGDVPSEAFKKILLGLGVELTGPEVATIRKGGKAAVDEVQRVADGVTQTLGKAVEQIPTAVAAIIARGGAAAQAAAQGFFGTITGTANAAFTGMAATAVAGYTQIGTAITQVTRITGSLTAAQADQLTQYQAQLLAAQRTGSDAYNSLTLDVQAYALASSDAERKIIQGWIDADTAKLNSSNATTQAILDNLAKIAAAAGKAAVAQGVPPAPAGGGAPGAGAGGGSGGSDPTGQLAQEQAQNAHWMRGVNGGISLPDVVAYAAQLEAGAAVWAQMMSYGQPLGEHSYTPGVRGEGGSSGGGAGGSATAAGRGTSVTNTVQVLVDGQVLAEAVNRARTSHMTLHVELVA